MLLSPKEQNLLLSLSRETLAASYENAANEVLKNFSAELHTKSPLLEKFPCFVSYMTKRHRLRGCIGALSTSTPLYQNVFHYTQTAAFEDPRFEPIRKEEMENLDISISVLGPLKPLPSLDDIEIGKHGLVVQFGNKKGVLLAKVAEEWGWNREQFLEHTCEKAGLPPGDTSKYQVFYFEEQTFSEGVQGESK